MNAITRRQALLMGSAVALTVTFAVPAVAESSAAAFPSRPVTLVVPFTAGSGSDTIARIIAPRLGELWKQAVIVDNRPGASGNLGADRVAKAAPDGHTLLMAINTLAASPALYKSLPFKPASDFTSIAELATAGFALVVNNNVPAKDMRSLVAYIKSQPAGSLNYASPGTGTPHHLGMELMKSALGIDVVHVPFKGFSGALTDTMGGQVQMMLATVQSVLPQVHAGKVRMLGVTGDKRSPLLPNIPTFGEQGITSLEGVDAWYAVFGPANLPPALVDRLHGDFVQVMQLPDVSKKLSDLGLTVKTSNPAELRQLMSVDIARWNKVVADAHIVGNDSMLHLSTNPKCFERRTHEAATPRSYRPRETGRAGRRRPSSRLVPSCSGFHSRVDVTRQARSAEGDQPGAHAVGAPGDAPGYAGDRRATVRRRRVELQKACRRIRS